MKGLMRPWLGINFEIRLLLRLFFILLILLLNLRRHWALHNIHLGLRLGFGLGDIVHQRWFLKVTAIPRIIGFGRRFWFLLLVFFATLPKALEWPFLWVWAITLFHLLDFNTLLWLLKLLAFSCNERSLILNLNDLWVFFLKVIEFKLKKVWCWL